MLNYPRSVLETIGLAHRDVGLELRRAGLKDIIFLGGGSPGEPCITKLVGYDLGQRPPVAELEGVFPMSKAVRAWLPAQQHLTERRVIRLDIDPEDRRPAEGVVVTVTTDHGVFTGTVGHRGTTWCVSWTWVFNDPPMEATASSAD